MYSQSLVCLVFLIGACLVDAAPEPIRNGKDLSDSASELDLGLTSYTVVSSTSIHNCAAYSANGTANATQNYASCYFTACGGTTVIVSGCGECSGDQYLVLYQSTTEMATDDDACGMCAQITYTVPGDSSVCNDYEVREGCTESESCSGTVSVYGSDYVFPEVLKSQSPFGGPSARLFHSGLQAVSRAPSRRPTKVPSVAPIYSQPSITCPYFSVNYNSYSATLNYSTCTFTACGGTTVTLTYSGSTGQYLRVMSKFGYEVSYSSGCSYCSTVSFIPYGTGSDCEEYTIREGCMYWYYACDGEVTIFGDVLWTPTAVPSMIPTGVPTLSITPTEVPTEVPTESPSVSFTPTYAPLICPYYAVGYYSYFATNNYDTCSFTACGGSSVTLSYSGTTGQYLRVMDESGSEVSYSGGCNSCSTLQFVPSGNSTDCKEYTIREGCQSYYYACAGTVSVTGAVTWTPTVTPSKVPTEVPTLSHNPTKVPTYEPTEAPSVSMAPTYSTLTCPSFYVSSYDYNAYATCIFSACGGSRITLSYGQTSYFETVRVFDSAGVEVMYDEGCSVCGYLVFTTLGAKSNCRVYTIQEDCSWGYCSDTVTVSGNVKAVPSAHPTLAPSVVSSPIITPTKAPVMNTNGTWYDSTHNKPSTMYTVILPVVVAVGGLLITIGLVCFLVFASTSVANVSNVVSTNDDSGKVACSSVATKPSTMEEAMEGNVEMI